MSSITEPLDDERDGGGRRREREHGAAWVPELHRLPPRRVTGTFLAVAAVATLLASILTVHGWASPVVIAGGAVLAAAPFTRRFLCRYGGPQLAQSYAVASIYLVLLSTLVLRRRSTAEIAATPLDSAGLYRVACLAAAAGLAAIAIVLTRRWEGVRRIPRPAMLTLAYIGAAAVPIVIAVSPGLASFRVLELVIFFMVFLACHRSFRGTWDVPIRHLMDVIYALLASAVVGAVRNRDDAFSEIHGSDRLKGILPQLSADYLGILGSLCVAYGLGHRRVRWLPVVFGTAFVVVSQHRTGLVAVAVVVIVRLLYQKRTSLTIVGMLAAAALAIVAFTGVADSLWLRGQAPEEIGTLSSRTEWWSEGIEAVGRSPVTGLGLSSGSRYEVFEQLGQFETPYLHGTWPEVLVGTGVVGLVILAFAYGLAVVDAARSARPRLQLVPLLFLVSLGVNSLTHTTFELGSLAFLVFLFAVGAGSPAPASRLRQQEIRRRTARGEVAPAR